MVDSLNMRVEMTENELVNFNIEKYTLFNLRNNFFFFKEQSSRDLWDNIKKKWKLCVIEVLKGE